VVPVHQRVAEEITQLARRPLIFLERLLPNQLIGGLRTFHVCLFVHDPIERDVELVAPHFPLLFWDKSGLNGNIKYRLVELLELSPNLGVKVLPTIAVFRFSITQA